MCRGSGRCCRRCPGGGGGGAAATMVSCLTLLFLSSEMRAAANSTWGVKNPHSLCLPGEQEGTVQQCRVDMALPRDTKGLRCAYAANVMKGYMSHFCTGALYSSNAVIVPASCVDDSCGKIKPVKNPLIAVGTDYLDPEKDEQGQPEKRETCNLIVHPNFGPLEEGGCTNDIAILILNESVTTKPVEVISGSCDSVDLVGWLKGGLEGQAGNWPYQIKCVPDLQVVDCKGNLSAASAPEGLLCAMSAESAVCSWDRGALLLCSSEQGQHLMGLASYPLVTCNNKTAYGYTDVAYYKDWIDKAIEENGHCLNSNDKRDQAIPKDEI